MNEDHEERYRVATYVYEDGAWERKESVALATDFLDEGTLVRFKVRDDKKGGTLWVLQEGRDTDSTSSYALPIDFALDASSEEILGGEQLLVIKNENTDPDREVLFALAWGKSVPVEESSGGGHEWGSPREPSHEGTWGCREIGAGGLS